jgi:hypothetical protein
VPEVQTHSKPFIILALKTDLRRVAGSSVITEEEVRCSPSTGGVRRSQCREHSITPPPQTLVVAVLPPLPPQGRKLAEDVGAQGYAGISPDLHFCVALSLAMFLRSFQRLRHRT